MRFMMMMKGNEDYEAGLPPDPRMADAVAKMAEDLGAKGVLLSMEGLMPSSAGAQLELANGKVTVTDGPFAEAKEVLGGYAIVELPSKEEAIEMGRNFLLLHAEILGQDYSIKSEVRQLSDW